MSASTDKAGSSMTSVSEQWFVMSRTLLRPQWSHHQQSELDPLAKTRSVLSHGPMRSGELRIVTAQLASCRRTSRDGRAAVVGSPTAKPLSIVPASGLRSRA